MSSSLDNTHIPMDVTEEEKELKGLDENMDMDEKEPNPAKPLSSSPSRHPQTSRIITVRLGPDSNNLDVDVPTVDVPYHALILSELANNAFLTDEKANSLSLTEVSEQTFLPIFNYLIHRDGIKGEIIPEPAPSKKMSDFVPEWEANFADQLWEKDRMLMFNVIMAANYMDIKCLMSLLCCKVGTIIQDEPYEKLKSLLIPQGYDAEEKK